MSYDRQAMAAFAEQVITDCNGRMITPAGVSLNMDERFGWQCMDLFIYIRYRLGFRDYLPTPDAASVWELNNQPDLKFWQFFDAITPDQPCYPGDIGIMNRRFFNNGVGHIFMIVADLGPSIRVLELNGLGDGREDDNGNQYGSPARIHEWPKTFLYGYLRWIGPPPQTVAPAAATITPIPATPAQIEDDMKVLATNGTDPQVWIGDGIIRRPVWTLDTLTADQWLARNSVLGPFYKDGEVQIIPDLNSIGLDLLALVGKPVTG